jgi:heme A synthase
VLCNSQLPAELTPSPRSLRWNLLAAILLVLTQAGLGIIVNLYVSVPSHHPGAHPSNYFSGSLQSLGWALAHGAAMLSVHAALGIVLVVLAVYLAVATWRSGRVAVRAWCALGCLLVIGAGFNGASFLDFNNNISSLLMAILAFAAIACYSVALTLSTA